MSELAERVIADVPGYADARACNSLCAHVFHATAFSIPPGGRGQATGWHTDDPLHNVCLPKGYRLPDSVHLPVLACTYMIWLSNVPDVAHGPTHVVPGSHRWGRPCAEDAVPIHDVVAATGPPGTAVLINSQTWHRGAANLSTVPRDTLQLSWGRRLVGHKYQGIMNYVMPEHVYRHASETLKRRLGFLPKGAYS